MHLMLLENWMEGNSFSTYFSRVFKSLFILLPLLTQNNFFVKKHVWL